MITFFPAAAATHGFTDFSCLVRGAVFGALVLVGASASANVTDITWEQLLALPPSNGQAKQPGVAGPFAGVHRDALIMGGGANFPDKMPWDGGAKMWWDDIWVLEKLSSAKPRWVLNPGVKLPRRLGYGVSVSTPDGVICVGGSDAERCYADVFLLAWDPQASTVRRTTLPSMPRPLAFMAGAMVGTTLYVAGGQHEMKNAAPSAVFWSLDLSRRGEPRDFKWTVLPTWPGPPRIVPVAAAQRTPHGESFFLFSGRRAQTDRPTEILADAYAFDPTTRTWRTLPNIGGGKGVSVMAGTAAASEDEVLVFGGDRGELFLELEAHDRGIETLKRQLADTPASERAAIEARIEQRLLLKKKIYDTHDGFGREVFAFDPRREVWRVVAQSTIAPQVTTVAVKSGDTIILPSGEIRPGVRTPNIVRATPVSR